MVTGLEEVDWIYFWLWHLMTNLCYTLDPQEPQDLHLEGELIPHIQQWLRPLNSGMEP